MELGISLEPPAWKGGSGKLILQTAQEAERLGFASVLMSSHILASQNGSAMDPLVLLSAIAGATSRIQIATSILVLPYYNPVVLANQAATLDVTSEGRFILGAGVGWNPDEFGVVGVPLAERGARTDESLKIMKALWAGRPVDFEGRFWSFRKASIGVTPPTVGGPRVWIGGHSDAALRRALRFADGWHGSGLDPAAAAGIRQRLEALGDSLGRDPGELQLSTVSFLVPPGMQQPAGQVPGRLLGGPKPTADSVLTELGLLDEAGISMCALWIPVSEHRLSDALGWVSDVIMPYVE